MLPKASQVQTQLFLSRSFAAHRAPPGGSTARVGRRGLDRHGAGHGATADRRGERVRAGAAADDAHGVRAVANVVDLERVRHPRLPPPAPSRPRRRRGDAPAARRDDAAAALPPAAAPAVLADAAFRSSSGASCTLRSPPTALRFEKLSRSVSVSSRPRPPSPRGGTRRTRLTTRPPRPATASANGSFRLTRGACRRGASASSAPCTRRPW